MRKPLFIVLATAVVTLPTMALAAPEEGRRGKMLEQRFQEMDLDQDGRISEQEMAEHRAARFDRADGNGDGLISEAEFMAARQARGEERARRIFTFMDSNGDGALSLEEVAQRRPVFAQLDVDGDGSLTLEELRAARPHKRQRN